MGALIDPAASATFHLLTPACADRVWAALTCPQHSVSYFHGLSIRSSWQPGTPVRFYAPSVQDLTGQVLFVRAPVHLSYTVEDVSGPVTYLTWTVRSVETGCIVRLQVHDVPYGARRPCGEELEDVWLPVIEGLRDTLASNSC